MMRLLIIGSLRGELGRAALIASERGASVDQADHVRSAMDKLRRDANFDLVFCEVGHDVGALVEALAAELMAFDALAKRRATAGA